MPLEGGSPAYYNIVFAVERYVHAVTVVGNSWQDFVTSRNWVVTVGSLTGAQITQNTEYGRYVNSDFDRHGKEIKIRAYGKSVGIYREDEQIFSFRWVAVFTTKTDCSGPFDWSGSRQDWRIPLSTAAQVITGKISATIDDCAIFHDMPVLDDDSPLPSFMEFDIQTKELTINISETQAPVNYTVKACAHLNDRVTTAKFECKKVEVKILPQVTSLAFSEQTFYQYEQFGTNNVFDLPSIIWTPKDALPVLIWNFQGDSLQGQGNGLTATLTVDSTAQIGTDLTFQAMITDANTLITASFSTTITVYECDPDGFIISPSELTLDIGGTSVALSWNQNNINSGCGAYSVTVDPAFSLLFSFTGVQIIGQAAADAGLGEFNPVFTLTRNSNSDQYTTTTISLIVQRPIMTGLQLSSAANIKVNYTIGKSEQKISFPLYHCVPLLCLCNLNLEYATVLISKTPNPKFAQNSQLNQQTTWLPSFFEWSPQEFKILGQDYQEGWNTYLIRVNATDVLTQFQDNSFLLEVETSIDCVTDVQFSVPDSFLKEISYAIGSLSKTTVYTYPFAIDSPSLASGIAQICGPVTCVVNQTDSIGSELSPLPSFVKFSPTSMTLSINTTDPNNNGTYYLLFDYYLSYFAHDESNKHTKQMSKLTAFVSQQYTPVHFQNITIPNSTIPTEPITANKTLIESKEIQEQNQTDSGSQEPTQDELAQEGQRLKDLISRLSPQKKLNDKYINIPLILSCQKIQNSGVITMEFNRPIQLNFDYFFSNYKQGRALKKLSDIDREDLNEMLQNAFTFEYRAKSDKFKSELIAFSVTDFRKSREIDIQIAFSDPLYVSFESDANNRLSFDQIIISLKDAQMFIDTNTNTPLSPNLLQKEIVILPRLDPIEVTPIYDLAEKIVQVAVTTLAPGTFIVNLLLGVSLKKLWSAVNLLQFVTYVNLWKVSLPANLDKFFQKASFFARGDWITKKQIMGLLKQNPRDQEDQQNLQTRFLILILAVIVIFTLLIIVMIYACRSQKIVRFCQDQIRKIFWNVVIRYSLQSYLDFAVTISLMIALRKGKQDAKLWIYSAVLLVIAVAPVGYFILLHKKFNSLTSTDLKIKIGTLYQGLNLKSYPAVCYNIVFFVRRIIFAVLTAFIGSFDGGLTVVLVVIKLTFFSLYLAAVKPQETRGGNRVELMSECLLTYCFFGMMVCLQTTQPKQQYIVGWFSVSTIITLIMICICYLASDSVSRLLQWLRQKCLIRKRKLEIQRRLEEAALAQLEINSTLVAVKAKPSVLLNNYVQDSSKIQLENQLRVRRNSFCIYDEFADPPLQMRLQKPQRFQVIKKLSISSELESVKEESASEESKAYQRENSDGSLVPKESKDSASFVDSEDQIEIQGIIQKRTTDWRHKEKYIIPNLKVLNGPYNDQEVNLPEQNISPQSDVPFWIACRQGEKSDQNQKVQRSLIVHPSLCIDSTKAENKQLPNRTLQQLKPQFSLSFKQRLVALKVSKKDQIKNQLDEEI